MKNDLDGPHKGSSRPNYNAGYQRRREATLLGCYSGQKLRKTLDEGEPLSQGKAPGKKSKLAAEPDEG